jgi:hypothetical protein
VLCVCTVCVCSVCVPWRRGPNVLALFQFRYFLVLVCYKISIFLLHLCVHCVCVYCVCVLMCVYCVCTACVCTVCVCVVCVYHGGEVRHVLQHLRGPQRACEGA